MIIQLIESSLYNMNSLIEYKYYTFEKNILCLQKEIIINK